MSSKNRSASSLNPKYVKQKFSSSKKSGRNSMLHQSADDFIRAFQASLIRQMPKEIQQRLLKPDQVLGDLPSHRPTVD